MSDFRVLVIGGYGFFGRRLVQRLSRRAGLHVIVAGRSADAGTRLVRSLRECAAAKLGSAVLDASSPSLADDLQRLAPGAVVHTSGPFQGQGHHVARACIAAGAHYIDLADGRDFVGSIATLDEGAAAKGLLVTSGASSVPALSGAAADMLARDCAEVRHIDIGISPGNRTERGLSTVQSILTYCGKPLHDSGCGQRFGWAGAWRHAYPSPVGTRLLSPCDVPDLTLLPSRYAGGPSVRFGAGLELGFLHRGMNAMAVLARMGLVRDWASHAGWLKHAAELFQTWGSDAGAMHVTVEGVGVTGEPMTRIWTLVAESGDGPFVPTLAASALLRKLAAGEQIPAGARPCIGLLSLDDFRMETDGLDIHMAGQAG
jgi:hypothetical protein